MSILLTRIDDRLVHGQVTVGWVQSLNINKIIVCDNALAASEWERNLYMESVPDGLEVFFVTEEQFVKGSARADFFDGRIIVLVESPDILVRLVKGGAKFKEINVGGMHYKEKSKEILPYVFVSSEDVEGFCFLENQHINITCQDTPTAKKHLLSVLLAKIK